MVGMPRRSARVASRKPHKERKGELKAIKWGKGSMGTRSLRVKGTVVSPRNLKVRKPLDGISTTKY